MADGVVVVHFLFILFTVLGGLLVLRWPKLMALHLPAAAWGVIVQVAVGGRCPLTPLENYLRERGHEPGIGESFIDHYITNLIYVDDPPAWLHPVLGGTVLAINLAVYITLFVRWQRRRRRRAAEAGGAGFEPVLPAGPVKPADTPM
jgi:hypothetical protein